jgi:hypothetical protein
LLRVELTEKEIAKRALRAANILVQIRTAKLDKKDSAKAFKTQIDALDKEHDRLSDEVRTRATEKTVTCERVFDFETKMVSEVRLDTGAVEVERPMTDEELQLDFIEDDLDGEFNDTPDRDAPDAEDDFDDAAAE